MTPEIAEGLGLDEPKGALVSDVTGSSPAGDAGITSGDVIVEFNGQEVPEMRKLPRIVAETPVGSKVPVKVWRKGKLQEFQVTLGEREKAEAQMAATDPEEATKPVEQTLNELGLKLSPVTDELREQFSIEREDGAVVIGVAEGSSAAEKGLQPGDLIIEVNQESVKSPGDVAKQVADLAARETRSVLLLVQRGDNRLFIAVRLDKG